MNEFCVACGDHLLPKHLYPALEQAVDNLVPSCANCNVIKKDFDPSDGKGLEIVLTEPVRRSLIDKSKEVIMRKKSEYARDFKDCEPAFMQAIARYRQIHLT